MPVLTQVVQRYKDIDAWNATPVMTQPSLERLETVMETAGVLDHADWVDFDRLVDNSYAITPLTGAKSPGSSRGIRAFFKRGEIA